MKKTVALALCLVALLAFGASSAQAAGPLNFYIRGGILIPCTSGFAPYYGLAGANLDLNLGRLSISPECDIQIENLLDFTFSDVSLLPGVILNINLANFYIGAGLVQPIRLIAGLDPIKPWLNIKANAGIKLGGFKLQLFGLDTIENFLDHIMVGATLGAGF